MANISYGPQCSCGAGVMLGFVARTRRNYGRPFYRCPRGLNHVGGFIWEAEYYADATLNRRGRDGNIMKNYFLYGCCLCNTCLMLLLFIAILVIMFRYM